LVFKGTSPFNMVEWGSDFNLAQTATGKFFSGKEGEKVHRGFWRALTSDSTSVEDMEHWAHIAKQLKDCIDSIQDETEQKQVPVWVTGHSLGAAISTLAFGSLLHNPQEGLGQFGQLCGAYTYGTPRVGNAIFAHNYNLQLAAKNISHFRIINANDIVTRVPAPWMGEGFGDVGTAVNFSYKPKAAHGEPNLKTRWNNWFFALIEVFDGFRNFFSEIKRVYPSKHVDYAKSLKSGVANYDDEDDVNKRTNILGALAKISGGLFFWLVDHAPSEYIAHIEKSDFSTLKVNQKPKGSR